MSAGSDSSSSSDRRSALPLSDSESETTRLATIRLVRRIIRSWYHTANFDADRWAMFQQQCPAWLRSQFNDFEDNYQETVIMYVQDRTRSPTSVDLNLPLKWMIHPQVLQRKKVVVMCNDFPEPTICAGELQQLNHFNRLIIAFNEPIPEFETIYNMNQSYYPCYTRQQLIRGSENDAHQAFS